MTESNVVASTRVFKDRTYNIAVVDDDKADFILCGQLLEYSNRGTFRLTHITSFDDAVRRLESEVFDAVLIDHYFDGRLGIDLIRRLGGRIAPCALIMLTGDGSEDLDIAALEAGVADYIDKNDLSAPMLARSIIYAHARVDAERQLRKSQAQLRRARDAAETANVAKSEFLARMSHQLLTPLNSILGFADVISNRTLGDTQKEWERYVEFADDIQASGTILHNMIRDVLDMSKIEAGDYVVSPGPLDVATILAETTAEFREVCDEKGVTLDFDQPVGAVFAVADPRAVRQILSRLLSNAATFTPEGGRISISVAPAVNAMMIAVSDTGPGIAEADLPRVLAPFDHIKDTYVSPELGSGLGLAISKSLAEMQGGTLRIESADGEGTTVYVTLPADSAAA